MVLPDSHRVSRALQYLGTASRERWISPTGLSPSVVVLSRSLRLSISFLTLWPKPEAAPQPLLFCKSRFRLFPVRSPLLGESLLISVPSGTEMFHFPPFASLRREMTEHYPSQVSPFGHPRVTACLAARRGFSQLAAPFIACLRQGILRMPLVAYPHFIRVELPLAYTRFFLLLLFLSKISFLLLSQLSMTE
jgi:hypothetical protein